MAVAERDEAEQRAAARANELDHQREEAVARRRDLRQANVEGARLKDRLLQLQRTLQRAHLARDAADVSAAAERELWNGEVLEVAGVVASMPPRRRQSPARTGAGLGAGVGLQRAVHTALAGSGSGRVDVPLDPSPSAARGARRPLAAHTPFRALEASLHAARGAQQADEGGR